MGNSEVGHLNIGAGRVVYQDMTRIDVALEDGSFAANPVLNGLLESIRKSGGKLHLAGLLSDGGVHSHIHHLEALCGMGDGNYGWLRQDYGVDYAGTWGIGAQLKDMPRKPSTTEGNAASSSTKGLMMRRTLGWAISVR